MDQPRVPKGSPQGGQFASTHGTKGPFSSRGDWHKDPLANEVPGHHTPAAQKRLIEYLEQETGEKFAPHGSVAKGTTSLNDFDIILKPQPEEDYGTAMAKYQQEEDRIRILHSSGKITNDEMMNMLYGDTPDNLSAALTKIGFAKTREMGFTGIFVTQYKRSKTAHTLDIWMEGDQGEPGSPPRNFSRDFNPKTGEVVREQYD